MQEKEADREKNKSKLTVCGSFGFGNAGDEALPLAIFDLAQSLGINLEIDILSRFNNPAISKVIGLSHEYTERQTELRSHPIILSGGGVIDSRDNAVLFRCKPYTNKKFVPKIALYGANVEYQTRYNWITKFKIKNILRQFDRLFVRDVFSAEALQNILPARKVEVIGDSVLWMKPALNVPVQIKKLDPFIAVVLGSHVQWKNEPGWYEWISQELSQLGTVLKSPIVFVPFSTLYDQDLLEHKKVADGIIAKNPSLEVICLEENFEPRELSTILGHSLLTISMRLHGCVMAYAQQVPFVALSYHPKVFGFAKTVGWEKFCLPSVIPYTQSKNSYGYKFSDTGLIDSYLTSTALDALDYNDFGKLESLKNKLADAFLDFWNIES